MLKRALEINLPNFINDADLRTLEKVKLEKIYLCQDAFEKLSWLTTQYISYLTVLAALTVCTNSLALQSAGSSIAAGIHTFLQMEKKITKRRAETRKISEGEQK